MNGSEEIGIDGQKRLDLVLKRAFDNPALSEWEQEFVSQQIDRLAKYGRRMRLSEKQWAVIERIGEKV